MQIVVEDCKRIADYKHILGDMSKFHIVEHSIRRTLYAQSILDEECYEQFEKAVLWNYPNAYPLKVNFFEHLGQGSGRGGAKAP